jgi:capsid assembly protease
MNARTLERFFSQEWHILPDAAQSLLLAVTSNESRSGSSEPRTARPTHDADGNEFAQMEILDSGLAIIPIHGPLVAGATASEKEWFGVVSYDDIAEDIDNATNQGVDKILLDIHSPGGGVTGLAEMAAKIDDLSGVIDVYSFNRGCCASAAEYLSAGATARFGVASSINGSIGTILQTLDISKMLETIGVKVHTFASGKYKATGNPYSAMTEDQSAFLKDWVKTWADDFKAHMTNHRPQMKEDHMQGQIFTAAQAWDIGLLDEIVKSRAEVIQAIS